MVVRPYPLYGDTMAGTTRSVVYLPWHHGVTLDMSIFCRHSRMYALVQEWNNWG